MSNLQKTTVKGVSSTESTDKSWSSVFPTELNTVKQSLAFVKKLVAVGVSTITYLRMIFPESSYKDKFVEGLNLKILMDKSPSEGSNKLIAWVFGCFDAIEKGYLREMIMCIYMDKHDRNRVLEKYTFKFIYTENGEIILNHTFEHPSSQNTFTQNYDVKIPTFQMIRTIIMLMQSLEPLPPKVYLSMKLYYYDHLTPKDYQPPGFRPQEDEPFTFGQKVINLKLGDIGTSFHSVKLRAAFSASQFSLEEPSTSAGQGTIEGKKEEKCGETAQTKPGESNAEEGAAELVNFSRRKMRQRVANMYSNRKGGEESHLKAEDIIEVAESQISDSSPTVAAIHPFSDVLEVTPQGEGTSEETATQRYVPRTPSFQDEETSYMTPTTLPTPKISDVMSNQSSALCSVRSVSVDFAPTYSNEFPIRCPCQVHNDDGLMILCDVCGNWQHGACFSILDESQAPARHYCELCADPPSLCTDPRICISDTAQVEATCLYRRALVIANYLEGKVSSVIIAHRLGVDISIGTRVIQKLSSDGVLKIGPSRSFKVVDKEALLKVAYPKYFSQHPNRKNDYTPDSQLDTSSNSLSVLEVESVEPVEPDSEKHVALSSDMFTERSTRSADWGTEKLKNSSQSEMKRLKEELQHQKENAKPPKDRTKKGSKLSLSKSRRTRSQNLALELCDGLPASDSSSTLTPKKKRKTCTTPAFRI